MSGEKSPDWLPAGWTVDLKVRKNGRKDMCYIDPSKELKFYSKPEVLRYLKKEQENSCLKTNVRKGTSKHVEDNVCYHKRESTSEHVENNVLVEKTVPEELPPGWTKELKETKRGRNIRTEALYTDPVTGYIFRSLKDVHRYLKTGNVGKHAFKPKDDNHIDMELNDEKLTTHSAAEGEKLADKGTNGQITGDQSSKLVETENDELTLESTDTANAVRIPKDAPEPCKENVAVGDVNIPEEGGLDTREEKTENELKEKTQDKKKKSKDESKLSLPRRASKRLAGVEVDLPREPKTRRQSAASAGRASEVRTRSACLASSVESETRGITDNSSNEKQANSVALPDAKTFPTLGKHTEEVETDTKPREMQDGNAETDKKPNEKQVLTPGSHTTSKDHGGNLGTDHKSWVNQEAAEVKRSTTSEEQGPTKLVMDNIPNGKLEIPNNLPLAKLVMDNIPNGKLEMSNNLPPTNLSTSAEDHGKKVEPDYYSKSFAKQELSNISPLADFLIPGEYSGNTVTDNKPEVKSESPGNLCLSSLWEDPCIEFAVKTLTGDIPVGEENRVDTYSGSPLEMPLGGLWADPCIEFAVKTLTGAIPVGEDLNVQQYFQQHACSSENNGENGLTLPDVGIDNNGQTQFVSQHFNSQQNSVNKQQECVLPMLPNHRNSSLQLPSGTSHQQHGKGNNGECSRKTFF